MSAALQKLVILHTNDIHSHFEQMPKIGTVIRRLKQQYEGSVITVDCGDHMDRMRLETEGTHGLANIAIMNATGYDVALLGNNEGLTFSADVLAVNYGKHADFAVLGSNLFEMQRRQIPEWLLSHYIAQIGGVCIGFIGVTANYTDFYELLGWDVHDPMATVAQAIVTLRDQVDLVVVLSHLGLTKDKEMAQDLQGIDLILGGHTHHLLEQALRINNTSICAAGKFGQYVGEVVLTYDLLEKQLIGIESCCISVADFEEDPLILELVYKYQVLGRSQLSEVIAFLEEPLEIDWMAESKLGNLLAIGLRQWVDAEIGIVNAGQLLQSLRAGEITKEHLLRLCPSPINPCLMLLRGEHIWLALEEALLPEFIEKSIFGFGFRGKVLGTLCLDGLWVSYNSDREPYHKINQVCINGTALDLKRMYRVGTIDMFTFGIGYLSLNQGTDIQYFLPHFLRDLLGQLLKDKQAITQSWEKRWHNSK